MNLLWGIFYCNNAVGPDMSGPYREANFYASGSLSTVISTKFRLMKLSAPESRV